MILMGTLIAFPTAIVGLFVCGIMNRLMDVPMRPYAGQPEPEVLEDDHLPSLWLSILPVVLPVVLISANTITKTMADSQHAARFRSGDVTDWAALATEIERIPEVVPKLPPESTSLLIRATEAAGQSPETQEQALGNLNDLLKKKNLFPADRFAPVDLPASAQKLAGQGLTKISQAEVERYNRLVLETLFPRQITPHVWDNLPRKAAHVTALLGDPNLALILSAAIAMFVLVRNRKLTFTKLAESTETALMSGGIIILITAGGGAFGAMLQAAGVKDSIESLIGQVGGDLGLVFLLAGFGVAAVFKVAQGSSTVAMMATAAMFAAMQVSSQTLGYHCVYLATAIGCGSLFGSWMNDSGFWIFAKMGNVTELEALKTWTILLAIVALVGLGFTFLFAWLLPLV
jgi:H+/gluconate symporter-like permease